MSTSSQIVKKSNISSIELDMECDNASSSNYSSIWAEYILATRPLSVQNEIKSDTQLNKDMMKSCEEETKSDKSTSKVNDTFSSTSLNSLHSLNNEGTLPKVLKKKKEQQISSFCVPATNVSPTSSNSQIKHSNLKSLFLEEDAMEVEIPQQDMLKSSDNHIEKSATSHEEISSSISSIGNNDVMQFSSEIDHNMELQMQSQNSLKSTDILQESSLLNTDGTNFSKASTENDENLEHVSLESDNTMDVENNASVQNNDSDSVPMKIAIPKTVTRNSIFSLQKHIPIIGAGKKAVNAYNLLNIKQPHLFSHKKEVESLRKRLRDENYITLSLWWLYKKKYLPSPPPCPHCGSKYFTFRKNDFVQDKLIYFCGNQCDYSSPLQRPKFFQKFSDISIEDLLILTFHFACQSPVQEILEDVSLELTQIMRYFRSLQKLCGDIMSQDGNKLGGRLQDVVEISACKIGNFIILGALERETKFTRLDALTLHQAFNTLDHLIYLRDWLRPNTIAISDQKISESSLKHIFSLPVDTSVKDYKSPREHTLNIKKYFEKNLKYMFTGFQHKHFSKEMLQYYLAELQWRDKYGKFPEMAFWNIFNHMDEINDSHPLVEVSPGDIIKLPMLGNASKDVRLRWGPSLKGLRSINFFSMKTSHLQELKSDQIQNVSEEPIMNQKKIDDLPDCHASKIIFHTQNKLADRTVEYVTCDSISSETQKYSFKKMHSTLATLIKNNSIQFIPEGVNPLNISTLLSARITFEDATLIEEANEKEIKCLTEELQNEYFWEYSLSWLISKGYVNKTMPCSTCNETSLLDVNILYKDGFAWHCQNKLCGSIKEFKRPIFFSRFGFSFSTIISLIFHWAVQTDINFVLQELKLDIYKIRYVWHALQELCYTTSQEEFPLLGGPNKIVEATIIEFGHFFILGALERESWHSYMYAFEFDKDLQYCLIEDRLKSWLLKDTIIIVSSYQMLVPSRNFSMKIANKNINDKNNSGFHILNITDYMTKHLLNIFGSFASSTLKIEMVQYYLCEIMWRERYGRTPTQAFWSILEEINAINNKDKFYIPYNEMSLDETPQTIETLSSCKNIKTSGKEQKSLSSKQKVKIKMENEIYPLSTTLTIKEEPLTLTNFDTFNEQLYPVSDSQSMVTSKPLNSIPTLSKISVIKKISPGILREKKGNQPLENSRKEITQINNQRSSIQNSSRTQISKEKPINISSACNLSNTHDLPESILALPSHTESSTYKEPIENAFDVESNYKAAIVISENPEHLSKLRCLECGKFIGPKHFMKCFKCGNCKNSTYSTYCAKAFLDHGCHFILNSSGNSKNPSQIHNPVILEDEQFCACGFYSNNGNILASHLLKCGKRTCYKKFSAALKDSENFNNHIQNGITSSTVKS